MSKNHALLSLIITTIHLLSLQIIPSVSSPNCTQSCGGRPLHLPIPLPYPFGFSSSCKISLNCALNTTPSIGDFPIQSVTPDSIKITIAAKCYRPLSTIRSLFTSNYAPTVQNAILMQNCSAPVSNCMLPATVVQTRFETTGCSMGNNSSISCFSQNRPADRFMDFKSVESSRCQYLLSAISAKLLNSSAALEVQTVELGWWLEGKCECDMDANCTEVFSQSNGVRLGYRCFCPEGFEGNGYLAGTGCRRVSSRCHPKKYLRGKCGGATRIAVLSGVIVGAALIVLLGLICCFIQRRTKSKSRRVTKRRLSEATSSFSIPVYTSKEIERATNSFSDKQRLGIGAYGTVYSGKLTNGEWVAIKRIRNRDTEGIEQVMNEINLISSVNHPNLVRLLGCSIENGEQILIYEFMPNGTLCQHLQKERGNGLDWPIRLAIATETARAITHLHSSINPPIFHRDIKSSNILLDYNFKSKVADFGLSRLGMSTEVSHISTAPQGTPGYLDPQYHQDFHLSDKSDVYSFGVVLVEIITGLKVVDFSRPKNEVNLAALAIDRITSGRLDEIIDPVLKAKEDGWTLLSVQKVAETAFRCLAFYRDMRPTMLEVAAELEQIGVTRNLARSEGNESLKSGERVKDNSLISAQDSCLSEHSSAPSTSLPNNGIQ